MKERKYVKFRVDMYEDTKSKIIDMKPERDLIHYVWNRFVILAGKVNKEGDLYMSQNIQYTVETLAIEFNRDVEEIKIALDVLIELEMIEFTEEKVYRVKNFAKHQNIKVKEKTETKEKNEIKEKEKNEAKEKIEIKEKNKPKNKENHINDVKNNMIENEDNTGKGKNETCTEKNEESKENLNGFHLRPLLDYVEVKTNGVNKSDNKRENKETSSSQHNNSPVILEMKKNQKTSRKNTKENKKKIEKEIIETYEDNIIENDDEFIKNEDNLIENIEDACLWTDGEDFSLKDGEILLSEWAF